MRKKWLATAMALLLALLVLPMGSSASSAGSSSSSSTTTSASQRKTVSSSKYKHSSFVKAINQWKAVNKDVVGYLKVPNTNINFPITISKDNDYYLYRDIYGKYYPNTNYQNYVDTATYLDFRTRLGSTWETSSRNMVVYSHNWNNLKPPFKIGNVAGYSMFGQLPSYTSAEFSRNNPHIYFSTEELEGVYRVFAVGYAELSQDFFYNNPNPSVKKDTYSKLLSEWRQRSLLNFDVDVDTSDRILTLSTCTRQYGNYYEGGVGDQQRFVVVARLLREGESENDAVTVTVNPNPKGPKFN